MTKPQHQGSLTDQLQELLQLANASGLYDAADYLTSRASTVDQIVSWLEQQATKEQDLIDSGRCNNLTCTQERWIVYKAIASTLRDGTWRKK